jgi:hypothetical protein
MTAQQKAAHMTGLPNLTIRLIKDGEEDATISLWSKAGLTRPINDPHRDLAFARSGPASDVLVGLEDGKIVASVMVGHDGHRGAVYYVSADPDQGENGLGRAMMEAAETWLKERDVWKLNLMVRASNDKVHGFYNALGYEQETRAVFSKRL